jgi:hypothetical protein
MLRDSLTENEREVDVVIEGQITVSVEVVDHKRPADVLGRADDGEAPEPPDEPAGAPFVVGLQQAGVAEGGDEAGAARVLDDLGRERRSKSLCLDQIRLTPTNRRLKLRRPDNTVISILALPDFTVFNAHGVEVGIVQEIEHAYVRAEVLHRRLAEEARGLQDRYRLTHFVVGDSGFGRHDLYLRDVEGEATELHRIEEMEIIRSFRSPRRN